MLEINSVNQGDCLELMKQIADNSVDIIVTSPPYYLNKEYEKYISYSDYCDMMQKSFIEWNRILVGGGYSIVNFGDYFNSGNRFYISDVPSCYPATINFYKWGVEKAKMDLQATRIWRKQFSKMAVPFVRNSHPRPIFDYEYIWTFRKHSTSKSDHTLKSIGNTFVCG